MVNAIIYHIFCNISSKMFIKINILEKTNTFIDTNTYVTCSWVEKHMVHLHTNINISFYINLFS